MDRRDFLKGTFGGLAAGGIVIASSTADIAAFASEVPIGAPVGLNSNVGPFTQLAQYGDMVYNAKGQPIGVIRDIRVRRNMEDISSVTDSYQRIVPVGQSLIEYTMVAGAGYVSQYNESPDPYRRTE